MPYQATVINVMIAGPSDVVEELEIARDVIYEWNFTDAEHSGVVAMPTGWGTHSMPEMGDRPQAIINRQVLQKADMLVAVFRARLGTPTGGYRSGTEEEIKTSIEEKRRTMVYFSCDLPDRNELDPAQYNRVEEFREWLKERGLYSTFANCEDFSRKFAADLKKAMHHFANSLSTPHSQDAPRVAMTSHESLSEEAQKLLTEAARDKQAVICCSELVQGLFVSTNGVSFCEGDNARTEAKWRRVIDDLVGMELIQDKGNEGEVFGVTDKGFRVADALSIYREGLAGSSPESAEGTLSHEAKALIAEAAQDPEGKVRCLRPPLGLLRISTNGKSFGSEGDRRSDAKWRRVIQELERQGLLEDETGKAEFFRITDAGYAAADQLRT